MKIYDDIKPRKVNRNYHEICGMDGLWMDFVCISIVVDAMAFIFDLLQMFFHIRLDKNWLRLHQNHRRVKDSVMAEVIVKYMKARQGHNLMHFVGTPKWRIFGKIKSKLERYHGYPRLYPWKFFVVR